MIPGFVKKSQVCNSPGPSVPTCRSPWRKCRRTTRSATFPTGTTSTGRVIAGTGSADHRSRYAGRELVPRSRRYSTWRLVRSRASSGPGRSDVGAELLVGVLGAELLLGLAAVVLDELDARVDA